MQVKAVRFRGGVGARRRAARRAWLGWLVYLLLTPAAVADDVAGEVLYATLVGEFALQAGATAEAAEHYATAASRSSDPRLIERAARLALLAERPELATTLLQRWRRLEADPQGWSAFALALALRQGDADMAAAASERLLSQSAGWKTVVQALLGESRSLVARSLLADLARRPELAGELDGLLAVGGLADRMQLPALVAEVAERVVLAFPQSARAWLWRAEAARKRGDEQLARRSIESAQGCPDFSLELRMAAASMLAVLDDPAAAAEVLLDAEPTPATLAARAAYLARAEDREGLRQLYDQLEAAAETPDSSPYLLGQVAELLELNQQAAAWYARIDGGDQHAAAQLRLAVLAEQSGDLEAARQRLHGLQRSDSDDGRALIDAFLLEAELLRKHQRDAEAIEVYGRGLAIFEDDSGLLYARALTFERLDQIDGAEADLRRLLELDPESADALNALGYTLADRTDRFDEAYQLIRRAIEKQPDNPAIIDSLGWVLFRMGRVEEALPHLRRAFELQRDAEVAAHLGEALWVSGQTEEALIVWRLGSEIDADNRALRRTLERYDQAS